MTDPTQPRTPRTEAGRRLLERGLGRGWSQLTPADAAEDLVAIEDEARAAAVAPYVEALREVRLAIASTLPDFRTLAILDGSDAAAGAVARLDCANAALASIPAVPEPPAPTEEPMAPTSIPDGDVEMVEAFYEASREHNGQRDDDPDRRPINQIIGEAFARHGLIIIRRDLVPEPPAAQPDAWLEVERLAVVAAARRFLAAHDHVIASAGVTRDDTFAMKNRVDELRDVLRLYDENAARLASSTARARVVAMPPPDPGLISGHIPEGR